MLTYFRVCISRFVGIFGEKLQKFLNFLKFHFHRLEFENEVPLIDDQNILFCRNFLAPVTITLH